MRAKFCTGGKERTVKVHRVVAEAFIPNPENKREVNHIDGNVKNNCASNLEWVTPSENMIHVAKVGRVVSPVIKPVEQWNLEGVFLKEWENARVAGLATGTDPSAITKCCKGKLKKTNGFVWKYVAKEEKK